MGNLHKMVKSAMLFPVFLCMGLNLGIAGPTMIDLTMRFNSTYDETARTVSATGVGVFVGALIGGMLVDVMARTRELLLTASQLLVTVALLLMPFVGHVDVMWIIYFLIGITDGVVNVVGQRILIATWKSKVNFPMQVMHVGSGIGSTAAPLITNSFLAKFQYGSELGSNRTAITAANAGQAYTVVEESRVEIAFLVIGIITALLSSSYFVYPFYLCCNRVRRGEYVTLKDVEDGDDGKQDNDADIDEPTDKKTIWKMIDPATYANGSRGFGTYVLVILFLFCFNCHGGQLMFAAFMRTFSVDELHFLRDDASYLDTTFWASFSLGRLVASISAYFIAVRTMLIANVILYAAVSISLILCLGKHNALWWIFIALVGFSTSPLFPSFVSLANTQIEVSGIMLSFVMFSSGLGQLFFIWMTGFLYDIYGPRAVLYDTGISAIAMFVIAAIFVASTYRRGERFGKCSPDAQIAPVGDNDEANTQDPIKANVKSYNTLRGEKK